MNSKLVSFGVFATLATGAALSGGCTRHQPTVMAPPVSAPAAQAPPMGNMGGGMPAGNPQAGAFDWRDVPAGQQVPVVRGVFDQGGYQLFAQSGETIVVPFVNQNLHVMKFGISNGGMYFIHDGQVPTLFVPRGGYLENAVAQNARWYPFSQDFNYSRPVYVGIAPSWPAFVGMGWYPGMTYYGGYWGHNPFGFSPMVGLVFNIGGRPYYGWNSYNSYYRSNPRGAFQLSSRPGYAYNSVGRRPGSFGSSFGRSASGSSGSFGRRTGTGTGSFGRSTGSGSFGSGSFGRSTGTGSFGRSTAGSGSFGRSTGSGSFGSGSSSTGRTGGSFGSGSSGFGSGSFGSGRSRGSFGSGSSGFGSGSFGRSSGGGSFGGSSGGSFGRSSGGSFGGGSYSRPSSGGSFGRSSGGSFGRSSGGSFGRRR